MMRGNHPYENKILCFSTSIYDLFMLYLNRMIAFKKTRRYLASKTYNIFYNLIVCPANIGPGTGQTNRNTNVGDRAFLMAANGAITCAGVVTVSNHSANIINYQKHISKHFKYEL